VNLIGKGSYALGDSVEVYRSLRMVTYKKQKANIIRRIARGRVTGIDGKKLQVVIDELWDVVKGGDRVGKVTRFPRLAVIEYLAPDQAVSGLVFERVEQKLFAYPYDTFILDQGEGQGIRIGDLFVAYHAGKEELPAPTQLACAVHVGKDYTTLATVRQYAESLEPGDRVEMVRRIRTE